MPALWELTHEQYASKRWVFHGTNKASDLETLLAQGVRMANVPQNISRQRYQMGEYAEYAPGAGIGQGLYVSGSAYEASDYGRHVVAIEIHSDAELDLPPESNARDLADAWKDHNGMLVVSDIPAERVYLVARDLTRYITGDPYETAVALSSPPRESRRVAMDKTASLPPEPFGMLVDDEGMAYLDGLPIYEYPTWDTRAGIADFTGARTNEKKISRMVRFLKTAEFEAADPLAALGEVFETIDDGEHTHSGLIIKAVDSGRVLLTQRTPYAEDPEGVYGRWEFPGGGIGEDEDAFTSALREFAEETGLELPEDWVVAGHYENGPYLAVVVLVPHEAWTTNASMLSHEVMGVGWFTLDQVEDTDLGREELAKTDWDLVREAKTAVGTGPFGWITADGAWMTEASYDGMHSNYSWHELNGDVRWRYSQVSHELNLEIPAAAMNPAQAEAALEWIRDTSFEVHAIYVDTDLGPLAWDDQSGETLASFFRKLQAGAGAVAMLHDEPEPALPSTDGSPSTSLARHLIQGSVLPGGNGSTEEADDPMSPAAIAQRQALLGDTDNLDIASAAKAYLAKVAVKRFTPLEQMELIEEGEREGVTASNLDLLEIAGTHYEALEDRYRYLDHAQSAAEDLFL